MVVVFFLHVRALLWHLDDVSLNPLLPSRPTSNSANSSGFKLSFLITGENLYLVPVIVHQAGFDDALAFSLNRILQCSHQFKAIFLLEDFNLRIPCTSLPDVHLQNPSVLDCHSAFVRDITESLGMSQLVFFPTRRNPHGDDSMLDLIFCNNPNWTANIHQGPGLGNIDHNSVHFSITHYCFPKSSSSPDMHFISFTRDHIFQDDVEVHPWNRFFDDTDIGETWENFTTPHWSMLRMWRT